MGNYKESIRNTLWQWFVYVWGKVLFILKPFQKPADMFLEFCLRHPFMKGTILFAILLLITPFVKNTVLGEIVLIPLLSLLFLFCLVLVVHRYFPKNHRKMLMYALLFFFILKLLYILCTNTLIQFSDERTIYHYYAETQVDLWSGVLENFGGSFRYTNTPYHYFLSSVYFLFGKSIFIGKLFNLFLHIWSGLFFYSIGKSIFHDDVGPISLILFFTFPSLNVWSLALLRESLLLFVVLSSFYLFVICLQKEKWWFLPLFLPLLYLSYKLRFYVALVLFLSFIFSFPILFFEKIRKKNISLKLSSLIILLVLMFSLGLSLQGDDWSSTIPYSSLIVEPQQILKKVSYHRSGLTYGRSTFFEEANISTWKGLFSYLPVGLFYVIASPFPPHLSSTNITLFFFVNNPFWYICFVFALLGIFSSIKKRIKFILPVLLYSVMLLVLLALVEANIGTLVRHVIHAHTFVLLFSAYAITQIVQKV